jgi:hypothetical protein
MVQNKEMLYRHCFSPLECAIRKVQETQMRLKVNGTHQLLIYADDVNLLGDNVDTIKKKPKLQLTLVRRLV